MLCDTEVDVRTTADDLMRGKLPAGILIGVFGPMYPDLGYFVGSHIQVSYDDTNETSSYPVSYYCCASFVRKDLPVVSERTSATSSEYVLLCRPSDNRYHQ